ncbi:heat shock protein transcriptional repressor HspR [Calditerrivibrio nitroreducens]|uniref:Transcriptional regulator, MerR family n=1 Tax=Calditerrivibrio nitroreducens (strain DSM 19672 / NBRC 101217 / Yu37-1) TaxID=768670 RepID=E4TIJ8_CALNY|nr:helix-turn-helix transcriptional regulator [Calditerrivibrio nitroreducens]ADR19046.1 transcriptional regulator, MerR family [Calditerrivibrio nitroreducens DSM 19672]
MKDRPLYAISIVAEMLNIHPQTLRQYERCELIKPSRTIGNVRLYSEEDIEKLKFIITLTRDMGVNLAGVEIILKMRQQMEEMRQQMEQMLDFIRKNIPKKDKKDEQILEINPSNTVIKVKIERE